MFVEISIEESVRRSEAAHRRSHKEYRQGRGYGGRYVTPQAIRALTDASPGPPSPRPNAGEEPTPSGPDGRGGGLSVWSFSTSASSDLMNDP